MPTANGSYWSTQLLSFTSEIIDGVLSLPRGVQIVVFGALVLLMVNWPPAQIAAGVGALTLFGARVVVEHEKITAKIVKRIDACLDIIKNDHNSSITKALADLRSDCIRVSDLEHESLNRSLIRWINDIDPSIVSQRPYRPVSAIEYLDRRSVYTSGLYRSADTMIRVALALTFATLVVALAQASWGLQGLASDSEVSMADQASALVGNLIAAAALKFIISVTGLTLAIYLRRVAAKQEEEVALSLRQFSNETFPIVDRFLKMRATGEIREDSSKQRSLSDLIGELIQVTRENTAMHREIGAAISRRGVPQQ